MQWLISIRSSILKVIFFVSFVFYQLKNYSKTKEIKTKLFWYNYSFDRILPNLTMQYFEKIQESYYCAQDINTNVYLLLAIFLESKYQWHSGCGTNIATILVFLFNWVDNFHMCMLPDYVLTPGRQHTLHTTINSRCKWSCSVCEVI